MKKEQIGKKCIEFTKADVINLIIEELNEKGYVVNEDVVVYTTRKLKRDEWVYELESIKVYISEEPDTMVNVEDYDKALILPDLEGLIFTSRETATDTLEYLSECIDRFGSVTLDVLYSMNDLPTNYIYREYGWTNLDEAYIVPQLNKGGLGYKIKFPPLEGNITSNI